MDGRFQLPQKSKSRNWIAGRPIYVDIVCMVGVCANAHPVFGEVSVSNPITNPISNSVSISSVVAIGMDWIVAMEMIVGMAMPTRASVRRRR